MGGRHSKTRFLRLSAIIGTAPRPQGPLWVQKRKDSGALIHANDGQERSIGFNRHKTSRTNMRLWERDGSCFDHSSSCLSQFYCWLPRRIRQRRRGYASAGIFTMAEADFTTTESTRKQVPCGPGERSRQTHMALGLPPICIRAAIRFVANTPPATRDGVVSSVVVHAILPKNNAEDD